MVYAICSGGGKQPGNDSKDSSAVQPHQHASLPLPESSPTSRPHKYGISGYNCEQATPVRSPDPNSASSVCGESRVERRAYVPQAPVVSEDLSQLLQQRYQQPGRPSSVGGSRQVHPSDFGTASRPDSLDSAQQPVSSCTRQSNPQSGDSCPCYGATVESHLHQCCKHHHPNLGGKEPPSKHHHHTLQDIATLPLLCMDILLRPQLAIRGETHRSPRHHHLGCLNAYSCFLYHLPSSRLVQ